MTEPDDLDVVRGVVFACLAGLPVWAGLGLGLVFLLLIR